MSPRMTHHPYKSVPEAHMIQANQGFCPGKGADILTIGSTDLTDIFQAKGPEMMRYSTVVSYIEMLTYADIPM